MYTPSENYSNKDHANLGYIFHLMKSKPRTPSDIRKLHRIDLYDNIATHFREKAPHFKLEYNWDKEAAELLLGKIIDKYGFSGVYAFFRALDNEQTEPDEAMQQDQKRFKAIISNVFVSYFAESYHRELLDGTSLAVNGVATMVGGIHYAPGVVYNTYTFVNRFVDRMFERLDPKIEVVEKMLPLLQPMHSMAQQCVNTFNDLFPDEKFPDIPAPETQILDRACRDIVSNKRFGNTQGPNR